jgi:hypothetical protein
MKFMASMLVLHPEWEGQFLLSATQESVEVARLAE